MKEYTIRSKNSPNEKPEPGKMPLDVDDNTLALILTIRELIEVLKK